MAGLSRKPHGDSVEIHRFSPGAIALASAMLKDSTVATL
jgi:hypothetical protein